MVGAQPSPSSRFFWVEVASLILLVSCIRPILAADVDILLEARQVLDPTGTHLRSWITTPKASFCNSSLTGVRCNERGQVTALILPSASLNGRIPSSIGLLSSLETLVLENNGLRGSIPKEIGNLRSLTELRLSSNRLSGPIPQELSSLKALVQLYLDDNYLSGYLPPELALLVSPRCFSKGLAFTRHGSDHTQIASATSASKLGTVTVSTHHSRHHRRRQHHHSSYRHRIHSNTHGSLCLLRVDENDLFGPIPEALLFLESGFSYKGNDGLCGNGFADVKPCPSKLSLQQLENSFVKPVYDGDSEHQQEEEMPVPEAVAGLSALIGPTSYIDSGASRPASSQGTWTRTRRFISVSQLDGRQEKQLSNFQASMSVYVRSFFSFLHLSFSRIWKEGVRRRDRILVVDGFVMPVAVRTLRSESAVALSTTSCAPVSLPSVQAQNPSASTQVVPMGDSAAADLKTGDHSPAKTINCTTTVVNSDSNNKQQVSSQEGGGGNHISLVSGVSVGVFVSLIGMIGLVFVIMRLGRKRREVRLIKDSMRTLQSTMQSRGIKVPVMVPSKRSLMVAVGMGPLSPLQWLRRSNWGEGGGGGGGGGEVHKASGWGKWYRLQELMTATNNFSEKRVLGRGGMGTVYLGIMKDGRAIAVKDLNIGRGQGETESWLSEIEAISRVEHPNLMKLRGCCAEGRRKALIYDYMPNGTLEDQLHGRVEGMMCGGAKSKSSVRRPPILSWENRFNIVLGAAKGLTYLHESVQPRMIHRDIKTSNILLDVDFSPQLSDFGLARTVPEGQNHLTTRNIAGTLGYLAPDYAVIGQLTDKSDVYSFGVLLLEVVTGRRPIGQSADGAALNIVQWVKPLFERGRLPQLVDPRLKGQYPDWEVRTTVRVALKCVSEVSTSRPAMSQVVRLLELSHATSTDVEDLDPTPKSRDAHKVKCSTEDVFMDARSFLPAGSVSLTLSTDFSFARPPSPRGVRDVEAGAEMAPKMELKRPLEAQAKRESEEVGEEKHVGTAKVLPVHAEVKEDAGKENCTATKVEPQKGTVTRKHASVKSMASRPRLSVDVKHGGKKWKAEGKESSKALTKKVVEPGRDEEEEADELEIHHDSEFYPTFEGIRTPPPLSKNFFTDQWPAD